ncbi:MAG: Gfo/Idh/MocA family oxidoreductase [Planctomycetales bacterium]|nr:Gfo/Idh/MocA family oxidoreductase [Planctomycetales bacterium]
MSYNTAWRNSSCSAAESRSVRVGIIGSTGRGDYGHGVDVACTKLAGAQMIALADQDENGRQAARKRVEPQRVYADFREMLQKEQLDIVAICPRWLDQHHEMITACAEAGCHIYMEKPFCRTLAECDQVVDLLQSRNLKLGIAHISQYSPVLDVVKQLIAEGEIGDVLELRARGKEDRRGGGEDLWVLGSHVFGLMRSLAGGNAIECSATVLQGGHLVKKADVQEGAEGIGLLTGDNLQARYRFASGAFGHFASRRDRAGSPSRFAIQVFGSKSVIEMESGYLAPAYILRDSSWSPGRSGKRWEQITSAGIGQPEPRQDGTYEGGHLAALIDLLAAIEEDRATRCSAEDARAIVEMIAAVFESHRVGTPVPLPLETRVNPLALIS